MTSEEFEAATGALLRDVAPMTLATCADNVPWASDVYFASSGFDLVFFSSLDSRHCCNLVANPVCAASVHAPVATWRDIRGLQMEGVAGLTHTIGEKASALATVMSPSQTFLQSGFVVPSPHEAGSGSTSEPEQVCFGIVTIIWCSYVSFF